MWDRLAAQIGVELTQLDQLLMTYRPLIQQCEVTPPDEIHLAALAAMLHSFYNGIENLLKRIALQTGEGLPGSEVWRRRLLDQMAQPNEKRPAVLTEDLRTTLRFYLDFRHVFRHAYTFDLRWRKMRGLVLNCDATLLAVREALEAFLCWGERGERSDCT